MQHVKKSGRITYRELARIINHMTEEQMDCDVTAADPLYDEFPFLSNGSKRGDYGGIALNLVLPTDEECNGLGLDDNHPVFIALETGE